MHRARLLAFALFLVLTGQAAFAEVVRVEILERHDAGTHERLIGRVHFRVDPKLPANRGIADLGLAPTDKDGMVEFTSDLLLFQPKDARRARGSVFLEVVNRGRDQSLGLMSGARQRDLSPESWDLGDRFLLGDPARVADELLRYRERLGITAVIVRAQWPGLPQARVLRTIRLLGERVLPRLGL